MKRIILIAMSMMVASVSAAGNVPLLEGTEWGPENGLGQYVQFMSGGDVFGFAGCNSFIGDYSQSGEQLSISNIIATKKSCDDMNGAEAAFLDGLKGANSAEMVNGDMRIYNVDGRWILGLRQRG